MDKIQEDLKEIERDVEKIDCHPILKFFLDSPEAFLLQF